MSPVIILLIASTIVAISWAADCKNENTDPAILATSEVSDFTFSGGAEGEYVDTLNAINDIRSGDPDAVGIVVVNDCITSNWDRIASVDFNYKYAYGYSGRTGTNYPTMELRLFQQSNPSNYFTIYESGPLDGYSYDDCQGQDLSCFSPVIANNVEFLGIDIVGSDYQFELIITNNDKNIHMDRDSLYIAVHWQECVTTDICDVEARVSVVDARYDSVEARIDSLIEQIQGVSAAHAFGGNVVGDVVSDNIDTFEFFMFRFTNTEILLLVMNILTICVVLCSCWKFKNHLVVQYSKAAVVE